MVLCVPNVYMFSVNCTDSTLRYAKVTAEYWLFLQDDLLVFLNYRRIYDVTPTWMLFADGNFEERKTVFAYGFFWWMFASYTGFFLPKKRRLFNVLIMQSLVSRHVLLSRSKHLLFENRVPESFPAVSEAADVLFSIQQRYSRNMQLFSHNWVFLSGSSSTSMFALWGRMRWLQCRQGTD